MKILQTLSVSLLLAAAGTAANAADEANVPTITFAAKRTHAPAVERVAPKAAVEATVVMPLDMPEADIDFHLPPIKATVERATS